MSQLSGTSFANLYGTSGTTFADNTTGDISEGDVRTFGQDIKDSFVNYTDAGITLSTFKVYHQATITLSAAQILALNSTPIQILAAPGANKIIIVGRLYGIYTFVSSAYATASTVSITHSDGSAIASWNVLSQTATRYFLHSNSTFDSTTDRSNLGVRVSVASANPTAGDSTLKFIVEYDVLNI